IGGMALLADSFGDGFLAQTRDSLLRMPSRDMPIGTVQSLLGTLFLRGMTIAGLFLGVLVAAALAANFAQVGFRANGDRLSIDWDRVSPFHFDRLLSWAKVVRGLVLTLKIV